MDVVLVSLLLTLSSVVFQEAVMIVQRLDC